MREHQGRSLYRLNNVRDGEGFSAARDPEQRLVCEPTPQTVDQAGNGARLIPGGLVIRFEPEFGHMGYYIGSRRAMF